jgi:transitional endoplasmic reticulum ATPase
MELTVQESNELEGTGKIILQPQTVQGFSQLQEQTVRLECKGRVCGAIVEAMRSGNGTILLDKHLRLHLRVRVGQTVTIEPVICAQARSAHLLVPPTWAGMEGVRLLKSLLLGRPVCRGQKLPVFTLSGAVVIVEAASLEPDGIVLIDDRTTLTLESQAERVGETAGITYRDIGGLSREIQRIRELVEYPLRSPEAFAQLGIEAPRGIILYGPPGTGKTLIAKALSNEVGAQFFALQGPEIVSAFYGESERQLREIFERARASAPAVILMDELDALAPKREETRGELERRLVATLLSLMDGLTELKGVVVIGTTNRVNSIDPALRRPGRFEHEIHIGIPDVTGRRQILEIHTRRMPLSADVDLQYLAEKTPGFVGADLASLCREAGYNALRSAFPSESVEKGEIVVEGIRVTARDYQTALNTICPSAMREVMVQVPTDVTWDQIGGLEEVKRLIIESVVYGIQKADAYKAAGIRPAKGLLLYGPPGTGKTLLAKAVANQCGANFIAVRGPEVRSKWFGESEEKIRFIFAKAREVAPAVIFFDEIDAIASARGRDASGLTDSLVNQLLTEMDGIETLESVFVIAATNASDLLDPALLRPGRFDLQVYVPLPDEPARKSIFQVHTRQMPLARNVDLENLARLTEGCSGADIAEVCRLAALSTLREVGFATQGIQVRADHFKNAITEVGQTQKRLKSRRLGFQMPEGEKTTEQS